MIFAALSNRRLWYVAAFALLLALTILYALTETSLGATLNIQMYLPMTFKIPKSCGTIAC